MSEQARHARIVEDAVPDPTSRPPQPHDARSRLLSVQGRSAALSADVQRLVDFLTNSLPWLPLSSESPAFKIVEALRRAGQPNRLRVCVDCRKWYYAVYSRMKYCSSRCRGHARPVIKRDRAAYMRVYRQLPPVKLRVTTRKTPRASQQGSYGPTPDSTTRGVLSLSLAKDPDP